jgi:hypothetical protein
MDITNESRLHSFSAREHLAKTQEMPLDTLIAIEWDTLRDLKRMLSNLELSTGEKNRLANALV